MVEITRSALFGKLDRLTFKALESAHALCRMRENPHVELVHWLNQILMLQTSDIHLILAAYEADREKVIKALSTELDKLPSGSTSMADFSPHLEEASERAYVFGSLMFGDQAVRSGHLLFGLLKTRSLQRLTVSISDEFAKIEIDDLSRNFHQICKGSPENDARPHSAPAGVPTGDDASAVLSKDVKADNALAAYTNDLTEEARNGKIDSIVGRDDEIRQVIDALMRRRQNNPILTGEAGVGKTAVVEGLAKRIIDNDVPPSLRGVRLLSLDLGALTAGASMRGEFEKRLKQVIEDVRSSPQQVILFIDEAHTLMGAGGQAGTGDAANLLKPALARGELRTIAATTWAEYKKYIEKDPALSRRFQVVKVEEPDDDKAVDMMRAVSPLFAKHHNIRILDEAIIACVKLSRRYVPDRQLPDKSVSLLDTACARVALTQTARPARVEDAERRIALLRREIMLIEAEVHMGTDWTERLSLLQDQLASEEARLSALNERWAEERSLIDEIISLQNTLSNDGAGEEETEDNSKADDPDKDEEEAGRESQNGAVSFDADEAREKLKSLREKLSACQGDDPLMMATVGETSIASVIADWTGVPAGRMMEDEAAAVLSLSETLKKRVVGQDNALEAISKRVLTARAGLADPSKPIGVFLLCGPSGVGKTETALALAESLYGGEQNLITLNMSEFQEAHTVSALKGSPPGYVGYGEGGRLTEAVRRRPYSVILLDEVEKAHSDVHEVFFQVFDKGAMEDGEGRLIDFKNSLILLTSNVGDDTLIDLFDQQGQADLSIAQKAVRNDLLRVFPAALLGRMITLPYYPLDPSVMNTLIEMRLAKVGTRMLDKYGVKFGYNDAVIDLIRQRCSERESGGRVIDAILTNSVLPNISSALLTRAMARTPSSTVDLDVSEGKFIININ